MDSEQSNNQPQSPIPGLGQPGPQEQPARPAYPPPYPVYPPPRRISAWRIFWGAILGLSVLANIGLFIVVLGLVAFFAAGQGKPYQEAVVREGPADSKIVMVNLQGIMYGEQAENVYRQLKMAGEDRSVKALILRVNSPGGPISASDDVYQQIRRYRAEKGKPVVAFMQNVAASGGYYASAACDEIVAEPTAITGSIGVLMTHFVFAELLENKLGILPVFLTMGEKKDWPSSFRAPSDQELQYVRDRLLTPAYERFVEVVAEGRQKVLSADQARKLADGSIYVAAQAKDAGLIDKVGYLDDAIAEAKTLAGIQRAQVVEYHRPFSWIGMLNAKKNASVFTLDRSKLYEMGTPEILYLWNAGTR